MRDAIRGPLRPGALQHKGAAPSSPSEDRFAGIHWAGVIISGVGVYFLTSPLLSLAASIYAAAFSVLAAVLRIEPGGGWLTRFTDEWGVQLFRLTLVAGAAALFAYRARTKPAEHGLLMGGVVATCTLTATLISRGGFSPWDLAALLAVAAGWLGGRLGRHAAVRQDGLVRLSRAIASANDADEIVSAIGDEVAGVEVDRVSLWQVGERDAGQPELLQTAVWERRGARPRATAATEAGWMPLPDGLSRTAALNWVRGPDGAWRRTDGTAAAAPMLLQVDRLPPPQREQWGRLGDRSILLLPLVNGDGEWIAVLTVGSPDSGGFRGHTVRTYLTVAAQVGLALQNLRLLTQIREAAVVEERARLARDLHDSVTQSVFSLGMMARAAQAQYARGLPTVADTLEKIGALAGEALVEMRALLFELRPTALAEGGLRAALEQLAVSFKARTGTEVQFTAETDARPLHDVEIAIFRIVQEALANAANHAQATEVAISMSETSGRLTVSVSDNGAGFDPTAPVIASTDGRSGGLGLRSMRERAVATGLALDISSAPGQGTTITMVAPVSGAAD